jgi:hypothetical protein
LALGVVGTAIGLRLLLELDRVIGRQAPRDRVSARWLDDHVRARREEE